MNLNNFIKTFGNKTFDESPFSDVDALIMAQLSYVNFELIAPFIDSPNEKPFAIKDIPLNLIKDLASNELTSKQNEPMLLLLKSSLRYRNIKICYLRKEANLHNELQFFAMTLILPNGIRYLSYRGTDLNLYAWKEDLAMAYKDSVNAQKVAINYLNDATSLFSGPYYIGGHSKGGNLAFYAALSQDKEHINRTIKAYSFDGQGFYNNKIFENDDYELISNKLVKIVPKNCVVGVMLNDIKHFRIVEAKSVGIFQHNPHNWVIDAKTGDFKFVKNRAKSSYISELAVHNWLASLTKEETIEIVDVIFEYLGGLNLTLSALVKNLPKTINTFFSVHRNYSKEDKKQISNIYSRFVYHYKKAWLYYNSKIGRDELTLKKKEND